MPKSTKAPPPYAPNNPDYPVQDHQPLLQHQYSVQASSPTMVHSPRSPSFSDPNLQYFEPLLLAPSCKFTKNEKDSNTFIITVYNHAHSQISQQLTAKRKTNKRITTSKITTLGLSNRISVTIRTQTNTDLIKIQRDAFGSRYLVKSPHNNNFPIGSIEANLMKSEFKLYDSWKGVSPVIVMKVTGMKFMCLDKKYEFFKAGTDLKIGSMESDGCLKFDRDFPQDAKFKTLALCTALVYKLID
jgi:hypothetical protein